MSYGHHHNFLAGRLPNGAERVCSSCGERQRKERGRWVRVEEPQIGDVIAFGNETVIFEGLSSDGQRMQVRRIRNGIPAKSTSWYNR